MLDLKYDEQRKRLQQAKKENSNMQKLVNKEMDEDAGAPGTALSKADEGEKQRHEEQRFYDAYRTLGRLQTFVWINQKGFQKIMKKYDKRNQLRGTGLELLPEFEKRLEKEAFCCGKVEMLNELFKSRRPDRVLRSTSSQGEGGRDGAERGGNVAYACRRSSQAHVGG